MVKNEARSLARELRSSGTWTIPEIATRLGVSKSSVSLWVRDICLSEVQIDYLSAKNHLGRRHSDTTKKKMGDHQRMLFLSGTGQLIKAISRSHETHHDFEVVMRLALEWYFDTKDLLPRKIGKYWFDFVNEQFIIELTRDPCHGASLATSRFESIKGDIRGKYLISNRYSFGSLRMARLKKSGAKFISIEEVIGCFNSGSYQIFG
jgi:transcriptional regulator with XRE-family HTH domain